MSNYPGRIKLYFDDSVAAACYLPIDQEEQGKFLMRYLWKLDVPGTEHLPGYEVPGSNQRELLWSEDQDYQIMHLTPYKTHHQTPLFDMQHLGVCFHDSICSGNGKQKRSVNAKNRKVKRPSGNVPQISLR